MEEGIFLGGKYGYMAACISCSALCFHRQCGEYGGFHI